MSAVTGLGLSTGIKPVNPVPVDTWSGPYYGVNEAAAKAEALSSVLSGIRFPTMTIRLVVNGLGRLYWFKDGTADGDLVEVDASDIEVASYAAAVPFFSGIVKRRIYVTSDEAYYDGEESFYDYVPGRGAALMGIDFNYTDI